MKLHYILVKIACNRIFLHYNSLSTQCGCVRVYRVMPVASCVVVFIVAVIIFFFIPLPSFYWHVNCVSCSMLNWCYYRVWHISSENATGVFRIQKKNCWKIINCTHSSSLSSHLFRVPCYSHNIGFSSTFSAA